MKLHVLPALVAALALIGVPGNGRADDASSPAPFVLSGISHDPKASLGVVERRKPDPESPVRITDLTFKGGNGAVVPADLQVPAKPQGRKPAVILLHGLGGNRKQLGLLATMLNGKGYVTLAIDAAGHGERPKYGTNGPDSMSLEDMRTLGAQTVVDLRRAVDLLVGNPDVDPNRIGYLGASMGGILGARFYSDDPRVKAGVFLFAGGDWGKLMTTSQIGMAKSFRERGNTDAAAVGKVLRDIDPLYSIARAAGRPILLIHGDKDDIVPVECNELLFKAAKEPKERVLLPGGHVPDVLRWSSLSMAFLDKHLLKK
ncbi:MAG: alpha/beta hydrolase [Armatimonadota bacterium]